MTKYTAESWNFGADGPFFQVIREGLRGLADGEDYFELLADDVVFDYVISVPGCPRSICQVSGTSSATSGCSLASAWSNVASRDPRARASCAR
jgi:hypothetical protein